MGNRRQLDAIIRGGYCIGCGGCSAANPAIRMGFDLQKQYQADVSEANDANINRVLKICPFSDDGLHEDAIGKALFSADSNHDARLGYYRALYAGYVNQGDFRERGTSGGIITWLLTELLKTGWIDHVIHIKKSNRERDGSLFKYAISSTPAEVMDGAKSRYYPIEISRVMQQVLECPGRYVFVGIPCFVKTVRRLMQEDSVLRERIIFCVGLVCGHLKSAAFADCFAWQAGIDPGKLEEIDFRVKLPDRTAGDYGVCLRGAGKEKVIPTRDLFGANWGHNLFRYSACDYCDDVFAETADVVVGDAWLPEYEKDPEGNSVLVVRNAGINLLIENAWEEGRLHLTVSDADEIAASQAGGLRDRREGLAFRLYIKLKKKEWAPHKRVEPRKVGIPRLRRRIYKNRAAMGAASHQLWKIAVQKRSFELFEKEMRKLIRHNNFYSCSLIKRCFGLTEKVAGKIFRVNKRA